MEEGSTFETRSVDYIFANYPPDNYSPEFLGSLYDYGKVFAEEVLDRRKFHLFDPMVSDRSCQLRAIWLACFYTTQKRAADLSEEDVLIFGLAHFLSESVVFVQHEIIGCIPSRSNTAFWPPTLFDLGNGKKRKRFFGIAKSIFEKRIIKDLYQWFKDIPAEHLIVNGCFSSPQEEARQEILKLLKDPLIFRYSNTPIQLLHFFPGFILLMTLAAEFQIILSVVLKKIECTEESVFHCVKTDVFNFSYNSKTGIFEEIDIAPESEISKEPVIAFLSYSYPEENLEEKKSFKIYKSLLSSLNTFFKLDLSFTDYIYTIMATHPMLMEHESPPESIAVNGAPVLTALTRQYLILAKKLHLSVVRLELTIDPVQSNNLCVHCIKKLLFGIMHVHNSSLEHLRQT